MWPSFRMLGDPYSADQIVVPEHRTVCMNDRDLVWGDGYYNGSIKTRKTTHGRELTPEEFGLQRSQQLRELYDSLSSAKSGQPQPPSKPSALKPEDLAETEWFFLVCMSCSFADGAGYMSFPPLTLMQMLQPFLNIKKDLSLGDGVDVHVNSQESAVENVNLFVLHKQMCILSGVDGHCVTSAH